MTRICLIPDVRGVGGMVSFRARLLAGLTARGVEVVFDLRHWPYDAVLVIGGTRQLPALWRARQRGVPIVQRLDGMNWVHRRRPTGIRHFIRAEYSNLLLSTIRSRLATALVYQSNFVKVWWERVYGETRLPWHVIYNGVDLSLYTPNGPRQPPTDRYRLLLVEGSLGGGYEMGLETAVQLAQGLSRQHGLPVELMIVGRVAPALQAEWQARSQSPLRWAGVVPREQIPEIDRSAHLLYSADLHGACPNAVVEALACGLPVVAFDTGALAELVAGDAGRVVAYGGDPWRIDPPDVPALAQAAAEILQSPERFSRAARARAEAHFGLDKMVDDYLRVLIEGAAP